jgi:ribosomal-protein-alanine N-acetyltransferase
VIAPDDDLDRIMGVMARAFVPEFGEAWSRRQLSDALLLGNCRYGMVTSDGGEPGDEASLCVGFFLARRVLDEEELLLFAIDPDYRRRGLGAQLLARFIASARNDGMSRILLEMRRGNSAQTLYAAQGFHPIGLRPAYYRTPGGARLDAVTQELVLAA